MSPPIPGCPLDSTRTGQQNLPLAQLGADPLLLTASHSQKGKQKQTQKYYERKPEVTRGMAGRSHLNAELHRERMGSSCWHCHLLLQAGVREAGEQKPRTRPPKRAATLFRILVPLMGTMTLGIIKSDENRIQVFQDREYPIYSVFVNSKKKVCCTFPPQHCGLPELEMDQPRFPSLSARGQSRHSRAKTCPDTSVR